MKKVLIMLIVFLSLAAACDKNSTEATSGDKWDGTYVVNINSSTTECDITTSDKTLSFYDRKFVGKYDDGYFYGIDTTWRYQDFYSDTIKMYRSGANISGTIISYYKAKYSPGQTFVLPFTGYRK